MSDPQAGAAPPRQPRTVDDYELQVLEAKVLKLTGYARQWADEALQLQREWRVLRDQMGVVRNFMRAGVLNSAWQAQELHAIEAEAWLVAEQLEVTANRLNARIPPAAR